MSDLKVTVVQPRTFWNNKEANFAAIEEMLAEVQNTDVILLPETFNTGFHFDLESVAEVHGLVTFKWMLQIAKSKDALVLGSYILNEGGVFYNAAYAVKPDGSYEVYKKRHLYMLSDEGQTLSPGAELIVISWKGWNLKPIICYDLRFPVWSRNSELEYDVLVCLANWPTKRNRHWDTLLSARAIENQSYAIGVNRIGLDENNIDYIGNSQVRDYAGDLQGNLMDSEVATFDLRKEPLDSYREKFPVYKSADTFSLD